jgi:hypothetical protein
MRKRPKPRNITDPTTQRLMDELGDYRWVLLSQLADRADELGDEWTARGWRWLRDKNKWPGSRKGGKCGWNYDCLYGGNTHHGKDTRLPHQLQDYMSGPHKAIATIGAAMEWAATVLGRWLKNLDQKNKEAQKAQQEQMG